MGLRVNVRTSVEGEEFSCKSMILKERGRLVAKHGKSLSDLTGRRELTTLGSNMSSKELGRTPTCSKWDYWALNGGKECLAPLQLPPSVRPPSALSMSSQQPLPLPTSPPPKPSLPPLPDLSQMHISDDPLPPYYPPAHSFNSWWNVLGSRDTEDVYFDYRSYTLCTHFRTG